MAINESPKDVPVVLLAVYNASGNFVAPAGKSKVYVTATSASGGTGGGGSDRYTGGPNRLSGVGGDRRVNGAWVNVVPGSTYAVTIGAGGAGGAQGGRYGTGATGSTGGTTTFQSAEVFSAPGSAGGTGYPGPGGTSNGNKGAEANVGTFSSSVGPLVPWTSVQGIVNTTNTNVLISTGNTGVVVNRYSSGPNGAAGQVYIYG